MPNNLKKLMREQVQESISPFLEAAEKPVPKKGWIKVMREALGMTSQALANRLNYSRVNLTMLEQREKKRTISLESLDKVAKAMNCKLVYALVPLEPLDKILEQQARVVAKKRVQSNNYSMKLEQQGLSVKQLKQQEEDLVQELLQGNLKELWDSHDEV